MTALTDCELHDDIIEGFFFFFTNAVLDIEPEAHWKSVAEKKDDYGKARVFTWYHLKMEKGSLLWNISSYRDKKITPHHLCLLSTKIWWKAEVCNFALTLTNVLSTDTRVCSATCAWTMCLKWGLSQLLFPVLLTSDNCKVPGHSLSQLKDKINSFSATEMVFLCLQNVKVIDFTIIMSNKSITSSGWYVMFLLFSLLSGLRCATRKVIRQESCCTRVATVSPRNTRRMRAGTTETPVTVAVRLSLPARCRLSARCLICSPSSSPNLRLSAGPCTTSTPKRWIWKTANVVSASSRSDCQTTDLTQQEKLITPDLLKKTCSVSYSEFNAVLKSNLQETKH